MLTWDNESTTTYVPYEITDGSIDIDAFDTLSM